MAGRERVGEAGMNEYFFAFEVAKQYPYSRTYLLKKPMKKSFKDSFLEIFLGRI